MVSNIVYQIPDRPRYTIHGSRCIRSGEEHRFGYYGYAMAPRDKGIYTDSDTKVAATPVGMLETQVHSRTVLKE